MEYGGRHNAGITGGPDQRLEGGKVRKPTARGLKADWVADFKTRGKLKLIMPPRRRRGE